MDDEESQDQDTTTDEVAPQNDKKIIPSAVGEIHIPNSKIPFDLNYNFDASAPITISSDQGFGQSTVEKGSQNSNPGFFKTAGAEAYDFNSTIQGLHAGYEAAAEPGKATTLEQQLFEKPDIYSDPVPDGWTPNSQPEMFYGIEPQYMPYLMDAKGPKDLQYRNDRVQDEQNHDETLANGSMFAKIIGGIAGAVTDPVSYVPIAGWAKYAKFAPTFLNSAARSLPGMATAGVLMAAGKELDKVNGNMQDFVVESAVNSLFGTAIFGGLGAAALATEKFELWNLRDISSSYIKGMDFMHEMNDKGEITGIKAFDTTGSMSAAEVSYAQDLANSSFEKSGVFKIPYLGNALLSVKAYPGIGSPLLAMMNSPYTTVRGFIDRAADHSIITKGMAEGGVRGKSFEFLMKKEFSNLRSIATQMNALHLQRMGMDINIRPLGDITRAGLGLYNKSLKVLGQDLDKTGYVSRDQFNDEIQRVLYSNEPSEHAPVNAAAAIARNQYNRVAKDYLAAHNLPPDYFKNTEQYLSRVYDTDYMNTNKVGPNGWVPVISKFLKESDAMITDRMEPIHTLQSQIKDATDAHGELIKRSNVTDDMIKKSLDNIDKMRNDLKFKNEELQNELRDNPDYDYHIDDRHALSANEAKELTGILKPLNDLKKQVEEQKKIISSLKAQKAKSKTSSMKGKTVETAQKHAKTEVAHAEKIKAEESKLTDLTNKVTDTEHDLYDKARSGQINPRLYNPLTHQFKDVNDRLKFRSVYENDAARESHAAAYYDSIMNLSPEDIINDVMGKVIGNSRENHLKSRTLLVPDKLLYDNNFMTKDLMAKISNYSLYVTRRTNLKNVYKDVTHDGGIEPLIENLGREYQSKRLPLDTRVASISNDIGKINETLSNEKLSDFTRESLESEKRDLQKQKVVVDKKIKDEGKRFDTAKKQMNKSYQKMMGLSNRSRGESLARSVIMSMTAMTNLHFLVATQIADIGAIGLQHGVWPFVRDATYPVIQSLGGILKTADSEAIRKSAPSVHLGLTDVNGGYGDRNWSMEAQPYLNLGRTVGAIEHLAHFSSNTDLTTYFDNGIQRVTGAVVQSEFMRILHDSAAGTMSKYDSEYLRKYGIDPKVWDKRMVQAYKDADGFKTALGGYQSRFWSWTDTEAANEFSDAVFRGIQNTLLSRGMFDSPFWADNFLGMLFHTFTGWGYASINRYLVPMLQRPDAKQILGVLFSLGTGALVSPARRMARGEDAVPDNMTDAQRFWETVNDSNVLSAVATTLDWANLVSGDRLLGDLKNDKYANRMSVGALGPVFNTANRMNNIFSALASGEFNAQDANQMARMLPIAGTLWGYQMSKTMIDKLGLPPTRTAAHAQ